MQNGVPDDEDLSDDEYDTIASLENLPQARVSETLSNLRNSIYKQQARKAAVSHQLVARSFQKIYDKKKDPSYHNISNLHNVPKTEDNPFPYIKNKKKTIFGDDKMEVIGNDNFTVESKCINNTNCGGSKKRKSKKRKSKKRNSKKRKHKKTRRHKKMSRYYKTK